MQAPGPQARRFAAYIEGLAKAAGHADRDVPLGHRLNTFTIAKSLHHLMADAPWSDEAVLDSSLDSVLPAMLRQGRVVDDTGFPKKGKESVGVARQYCGQSRQIR